MTGVILGQNEMMNELDEDIEEHPTWLADDEDGGGDVEALAKV